MPRIMLLTTGGTIACTTTPEGVLRPTLTGTQLVDGIRDLLPDQLTLDVRDMTRLDSSAISLADVDNLIAAVQQELADPEIAGVVITHGTDSLEETALALDCFHHDERPIVLTGAQRGFDHDASDGPSNLVEATRLAADPLSRGQGVLIAFGGWTIPARGAAKCHTSDLVGFISTTPPEVPRPQALAIAPLAGFFVPIISAWPGCGRELIDASVAAGAHGIVVEALGSGNMGPVMGQGVADALAQNIPVVVSTRVPSGEVRLAYGGDGGGATLGSLGAVGSGYLRAGQSRIALIVSLATDTPIKDLL